MKEIGEPNEAGNVGRGADPPPGFPGDKFPPSQCCRIRVAGRKFRAHGHVARERSRRTLERFEPEISRTPSELQNLLERAWHRRQESRPGIFQAVYPVKTMPVSVTGTRCALNCSHCGAHYLEHMVDIKDLERRVSVKNPSSLLVSGGCNSWGEVPLRPFWERIKAVEGLRLNVHPGVIPKDWARKLAQEDIVISFDFVLDDEAISWAFNGNWTKDDYIEIFDELGGGKAQVVPHILVGLRKGVVLREYDALEHLLSRGVKKIIFIVFIPTRGTRWEHLSPPPVKDVVKLFAWTRAKSPSLDISLGCMRPKGKYRRLLDLYAVRAGVDRIVVPHPEAVTLAANLGLRVARREECCAFDW